MESHPARTAAHFVGSQCRREPTCPYLRRRRCLFFHSEDEMASASVVGQDQPPDVPLMVRIVRLEQAVSLFVGVPVPQIMEDLVDGVQAAGARAEPSRRANRGRASAPNQGGRRGKDSACASRARTSRGADRGCAAVDPRSTR